MSTQASSLVTTTDTWTVTIQDDRGALTHTQRNREWGVVSVLVNQRREGAEFGDVERDWLADGSHEATEEEWAIAGLATKPG